MTTRVRRLDAATISRIAAGEVIERPASVVKELIENALDAASSRIDIVLQNGGRRLIQVTDNGVGMAAEDAALALQRFTTSKIRALDDLRQLATLGFRGEALPSMAVMADVDITTRPIDAPEGVMVQCLGGQPPCASPVGCPPGTRVRVHRLFASTPVRLNALKSVSREVQQIHELVGHYAMIYPQVTFQLQHDGRRLLFAPAGQDVMQRLPALFQRDLVSQMLPVRWQSVDLIVYGAISQPTAHRGTRQRQYFWVNGRPIRSTLISAAMGRAYGALLPPGRYPLAALGLVLPAAFLDVNVHPRKQEVTFIHERAVFAAVQEAVHMALQGQDGPEWAGDAEFPPDTLSWPDTACMVAESGSPFGPTPDAPQASSWHFMGQIGNTFLVAGGAQGLVLLDQHAAHESLIYVQLMAGEGDAHELPDPFVLALSVEQARWLTVVQAALSNLGCHLEPFGHQTVLLRAVPAVLLSLIRPGTFLEALDEVRQRLSPQAPPEAIREQLAAALSCRTAVRAGDTLDTDQVTALVDAFGHQQLPYTCPHGRPTYVTMTLSDLERRFLRLFSP